MVTDTRRRLVRCFQAVFPKLSESEAASACQASMAAWDSVATVTLVAALEEEFGIQLEPEEIEKMNSFQNWLTRLTSSSCA
jgi:acyl carrier protein